MYPDIEYIKTCLNGLHSRFEKVDHQVGYALSEMQQKFMSFMTETTFKFTTLFANRPDWGQNDPAALDYVKGRTHWEESNATDISGQSYTIAGFTYNNLVVIHDEIPLELGQVWSVQYVGPIDLLFENMAVRQNDEGVLYLGDLSKSSCQFWVTKNKAEIRADVVVQSRVTALIVTCISGGIVNIVHPLEPKFIPTPTADTVGAIKADPAEDADTQPVRLGKDGKLYTATVPPPIPNWNATEGEAGYIQSRPFYEDVVTVIGEIVQGGNGAFEPISEDLWEVLLSGSATVECELGTYMYEGTYEFGMQYKNSVSSSIQWLRVSPTEAQAYFLRSDLPDGVVDSGKISVTATAVNLKQIAPKFLPVAGTSKLGGIIAPLSVPNMVSPEQLSYVGINKQGQAYVMRDVVVCSSWADLWGCTFSNGIAAVPETAGDIVGPALVFGLFAEMGNTYGTVWDAGGGIYTVQIDGKGSVKIINVLHKLIPAPATAAVGQVVVVKAVDETGRPTEWEATDPMVVNSSTEGSSKRFKIAVDDAGTISAIELHDSEDEDEGVDI